MKIHVSRVPEEGLTQHDTCDPGPLDMERSDVRLPEPFDVDARIALAEKELIVNADIRCPLQMTCGRCLEEFRSMVRVAALFSYHVQPTEVVDITNDVRQEIILAYPMIPLCRPECKGLCRECGHNLNAGACVHQQVQQE